MGSDLGLREKKVSYPWLSHLVAMVIGGMFVAVFLQQDGTAAASLLLRKDSGCEISFGKYEGPEYKTGDTVGKPKCLVQSRFLKLQQHHVRMPSGSNTVIPDWLWVDYHDRINVLVQAPAREGKGMEFFVFDQSKYALEGRQSVAIVGGIVEPGEEPEKAARREVKEEMKVNCATFKLLGRFRTDVNRGVGWTNSFVALGCRHITATDGENEMDPGDEVGIPDTEKQVIRRISLKDLKNTAEKGNFLEIQWTATVGTALLQPELQ